MKLPDDEQERQELYRDARITGKYDSIWQSVGKCVFCDMRQKYIVHEENGIALTVTLYAYIDGHLLIAPRRHVLSLKELTSIEWEAVRKMMYIAKKLIKKVHGTNGIQYIQKDGVGSQSSVNHLHFHCIPFDAPDLSVWNFRKLQYTPIENAQLYQEQAKTIRKLAEKFDTKYAEAKS